MLLVISSQEQIKKFELTETPKEWGECGDTKTLGKMIPGFKSRKIAKLVQRPAFFKNLANNYITNKFENDPIADFSVKSYLPLGADHKTHLQMCIADFETFLMRLQDEDEREFLREKKFELSQEFSEEAINRRSQDILNAQIDQILADIRSQEEKKKAKQFKELNSSFEALGMAERI